MTLLESVTYYDHDAIPCRVITNMHTQTRRAEGYFVGKGYLPVAIHPVLREGEILTEREFKKRIAALSISARKRTY